MVFKCQSFFLQWNSHVPADHHVLLATVLKKEKKQRKTPPAPHNTTRLNLYMHVLA